MGADSTISRAPDARFLFAHPAHFIALGFGSGLAPKAPGTFGTLVAFPLCWALLPFLHPLAIAFVAIPLFFVGVWACEITGRDLKRGVALRRNNDWHVVDIGGARCFAQRAIVAFEDDVRICAPKAERVGADNQLAILLQRRILTSHFDIPLVEVDVRIRILYADGGRHDAMLYAMQRLHQAGHT